MAKRAAEIKTKREAMRLLRNIAGESSKTPTPQYQHNDFLKAIIEQQKIAQQQELEHKQKLQQEQQVYIYLYFEIIFLYLIRNKNVNVKN